MDSHTLHCFVKRDWFDILTAALTCSPETSGSCPFVLRCTGWRRGHGADLNLCPQGCLVHHLCWPRTQSHTLVSLNKLVRQQGLCCIPDEMSEPSLRAFRL
ncbi:unnamed protein product [Pleuronectes platessa]|uniref:Uncharacterized protein n=1 Tax=Pleuronectes platessa TaxID=8262 RepID=A0A9N7ZA41_PLEPL|nr:unnamed protein product [Pleuronectes platessa]